jgi:hypothetical protein
MLVNARVIPRRSRSPIYPLFEALERDAALENNARQVSFGCFFVDELCSSRGKPFRSDLR